MANVIRDLASYDRAKVSRNVSDLLWFYDSPSEALAAARDFLFSVSADLSRALVTNDAYDSLEILWHLLASFDRAAHAGTGADSASAQSESRDERNRMVVIGGYGWGKSTLALVAAQFLGLPDGDEGHSAAIAALDPDSGDAPRQLVDKAQSRKPKFTVCIKGANRDFHELFVSAVASSKVRYKSYLERHGITLKVKSEYDAALEWLNNLADAPGFDTILRDQGVSLAALLTDLSTMDPDALSRADAVWQRYNRVGSQVRPVWYSQADTAKYLGELVEAVAGHPDSPFDGVLVLFDELGLWLAYANENENRAGGPAFLAFMEAAQKYRNRLTVCSFIQADIEAFVGRDTASNNVRHMSERLGVRVRYRPDLERVFQSAIRQGKDGRKELWGRHEADFDELAGRLVEVFDRYRKGTWAGPGRVKDILVRRCWPIHPFMVAAVCHLRFGQGHRVIQILEDQFPKLGDKLIEDATGALNWSTPIDVVDFYQSNFENLHSADGERRIWDRYALAKSNLRAPEDDPAVKVLKAVFLAHALAGSMRVHGADEFVEVIRLFSGLPDDVVASTLNKLSSSHGAIAPLLLANDATGWYEFFAIEQNPTEAREYVIKRYDEAKGFEFGDAFGYFTAASLSPSAFAQSRHLQVHGYHHLFEIVVDVNNVNPNYLTSLAVTKVLNDIDPEYRGLHVVVLYSEEKKPAGLPSPDRPLAERVREYCQQALNEAWRALSAKGDEVPIVLSVPTDPPNELYRSLGLIRAAKYVPPEDAKRLGAGLTTFIEIESRRVERTASGWANPSKLALLVPDSSTDPRLAAIRKTGHKANIIASMFEAVFPTVPPLNHAALGGGGTKYVKYVRSLVEFLLNPQRQRSMPQEHQNALDAVLASASSLQDRNWMSVDETASGFTVVPPRNVIARQCFEALDTEIRRVPVGTSIQVRSLWKKFSKAPYGLDVRSFLLLLSNWFATHRDECLLHDLGGEDLAWTDIVKACERRSDMFDLVTSGYLSLQLRDTASELARLRALLQRMQAWRPGDSGGEQLLEDRSDLASTAPGASEWGEVAREVDRISQAVARDAEQVQAARDFAREVEENCTLENLKDYARRLNGLALRGASTNARDALETCLRTMLQRAQVGAAATVNRKYASADVERHELERSLEFVDDSALLEVAKTLNATIADEAGRQVNDIIGQLRGALATVEARFAVKQAAEDRIAAFKRKWEAALSEAAAGDAGLAQLVSVGKKLDDLSPECPEGLRLEFDRAAAAIKNRVTEAEREVNAWVATFGRAATVEEITAALARISDMQKIALGTELQADIEAVAANASVYASAVESYRRARKTVADTPVDSEAAIPVIGELQARLQSAAHGVVLKAWCTDLRQSVDERKRSAEVRAHALDESLRSASTADAALRAHEDINTFVREHGAYARTASERLIGRVRSLMADNAPAQIAVILRPIPEEDRKAIVEKALSLLGSR